MLRAKPNSWYRGPLKCCTFWQIEECTKSYTRHVQGVTSGSFVSQGSGIGTISQSSST